MSESRGLTSSCNCTGCGMLRAGVCINCAEKIAALIFESGPRELAVEPCSGACREAIEPRRQSAGARRSHQVGRDNPWRAQCALPRLALGVAAGALSEVLL